MKKNILLSINTCFSVLVIIAYTFLNANAATPITARISVDSNGTQANGSSSWSSISGQGRYVAFLSDSTNLVTGDTNAKSDVFIYDSQSGTVERVSVHTNGTEGDDNDALRAYTFSDDGRYLVFESRSTNLVDNDTNGVEDIFIHDLQTSETSRISVNGSGVQGDGRSQYAAISADGRYIAFESEATNLISTDTNGRRDIFVHDRQTGTVTRVSVKSDGTVADDNSYYPVLSSDGRYVAFYSYAANLVDNDTNGVPDVFVHDRQTGTTTRVSVHTNGTQANSDSYYLDMSSDGRYIVFESYATSLVDNDTNQTAVNNGEDVFVHDTQTSVTTRVNVDSLGNASSLDSVSYMPTLSADGRFVTFQSDATNLVLDDTNGREDIFMHDRQTGETVRISIDSSGSQADNGSARAVISEDGRYVAFGSWATNLVDNDSNSMSDVFLRGPLLDIASPSFLYWPMFLPAIMYNSHQ